MGNKTKYIAIGILLGLAIATSIAATVTPTNDTARFQMMEVNSGFTVVLDTQTGTINRHYTSINVPTTVCLPFNSGLKDAYGSPQQ